MDRGTIILLALVVAPVPLIIIGAFIRGYDVTIVFTRRRPRE